MSYNHLTMDERNVIYRMQWQGYSNAEIARCLGCHRSTIGREFARPAELERRLCLKVFFAHPYHAWELGTNENTNGLLRQYLPRDSDLSILTDNQLRSYVSALNHRPRKCLVCQSPFEVFHQRQR